MLFITDANDVEKQSKREKITQDVIDCFDSSK